MCGKLTNVGSKDPVTKMKLKTLILKFLSVKWTVGFIENDLDSIIVGDFINIHWIRHSYTDRWFADPFILDVTENEIILLCEEYYYPIKRGRIAKLVIDKKTRELKECQVVLELDTHLSFPAIFRKGDDVYIYPENSENATLSFYKYDIRDNKCIKCGNLIEEPLTDAIFTEEFGEKIMFSTKLPRQNKDVLDIYNWKKDKYIKSSSVKFHNNIARNAGDFFQINGEVYRPAQDCNNVYGGAVILQKVTKNVDFIFENIRRIESDNSRYNIGCHTFNHYEGYTVIDAKGYRFPLIAKMLMFIRNILK